MVKRRFPVCFLFIGFYLITFIVTATSYGLFFAEPADRLREYSWIYYGIFSPCCLICLWGHTVQIYSTKAMDTHVACSRAMSTH